jgi:hypothetical protein
MENGMSTITNIMLITECMCDPKRIETINTYLKHEYGHGLVQVDDYVGAKDRKAFEADVYMAAYNVFDTKGFLKCFYSIKWEYPECIQLLIKLQDDDKFTIYTTKDNDLINRNPSKKRCSQKN